MTNEDIEAKIEKLVEAKVKANVESAEKATLIARIAANKKSIFKEDGLKKLTVEELKEYERSIAPTNYGPMAANQSSSPTKVTALTQQPLFPVKKD